MQRSQEASTTPTYRPDIDGLRAVAILSVLIFHAFPARLPGGFVGVDVFFVISGFLISGIIFRGMRDGTFSFAEFYAHRVKRIFPALVTMLAAVFAFGWFVLLPDEFAQFGKHMAAGAGFVLNFVLWGEAGYFDTASELKPLMHLWSLAIEEQFYLLYPLIMLAAWRLRLNALAVVALLAGASFALNIHGVGKDAIETFFVPQTRFWELLAGSILAYFHVFKRAQVAGLLGWRARAFLCDFLSVGGAALIIGATLALTGKSLFPGWAALAPVAGAFAIIAAGPEAWFNRAILSSRPMVFIGKISYPLYLWHWPVLSFWQIIEAGAPSPEFRAAAVLVSIVLAWLTYQLIEKPIRFGPRGTLKTAGLCASLAVACVAGYLTFDRDGLRHRDVVALNASAATATLGAGKDQAERYCGEGREKVVLDFCYRTKGAPVRYAVWGDSKADALYWGLAKEASATGGWMIIGRAACAPMAGIQRVSRGAPYPPAECAQANEWALETLVSNPDLKVVLIVTAQRIFASEKYAKAPGAQPYEGAAVEGMRNAVSALERAGKRVIFVVDNPTLPDPKKCMPGRLTEIGVINAMMDRKLNPGCHLGYEQHMAKTVKYRRMVDELRAADSRLQVFNPTDLLCDRAKGVCPVSQGGSFLYSYDDHISDYAAARVAREIAKLVDQGA